MDKRETFERVRAHLTAQGQRSTTDRHGRQICAYRGDGGRMCAAGTLIPDALYDDRMEGETIDLLLERWPQLAHHLQPVAMIRDLQFIHDHTPADEWPERLAALAEVHGV